MGLYDHLLKARYKRAERDAAAAAKKRKEKLRERIYPPERRCPIHDSSGLAPLEQRFTKHQASQSLKEKMLAKGWCYHHVNHLSNIYGPETFSYLATLERSPYRLSDHKRCLSHTACVSYNTEMATYKTRHVTEDCDCPMVQTPYNSLVQIIRKGEIPLISIDGGSIAGATHNLTVQSRSRKTKYIAISHVWADGLGNPTTNALPSCQVKQLKINLLALQKSMGYPNVSGNLVSLFAVKQRVLRDWFRNPFYSGWIHYAFQ